MASRLVCHLLPVAGAAETEGEVKVQKLGCTKKENGLVGSGVTVKNEARLRQDRINIRFSVRLQEQHFTKKT